MMTPSSRSFLNWPLGFVFWVLSLPIGSVSQANSDLFNLPEPPPSSQKLLQAKAVINYVSDYQEDQQLFMDAQANIDLSAEMAEALIHEIPLNFKTEIVLSEKSNFLGLELFNSFKNIEYETELRYFGYTQTYILTNKRNKQNRTFKTLKEALYTLSVLYNFPITELSRLHPSNAYQLKLRLSLMPDKLPAPLILKGYFSDAWQLDTQWHKIEIHSPLSWY